MKREHDYCVILAGGVGRRLWPCSRKDMPKQFVDFFGTGRTLLQQTYDRFASFLPASHIYVSTYAGYEAEVRAQLPDLPAGNVLAEPVQLSTAPAVAWASYHISRRDPEACVIVSPSDHHILRDDRFAQQLCEGLDFVRGSDVFLAMGAPATQPNTAYGYIQRDAPPAGGSLPGVKSFTEKPSADYARMFVESGEFLWNTGLFLCHVRTMNARLRELQPEVARHLTSAGPALSSADEQELVARYYPSTTHRSIDLVILSDTRNVCVKECDFGWADIGSWPELYRNSRHDADGNAVASRSPVLFSGSSDNLVCLPEGMGAVVCGLSGYLVAQQGNALVICPNDDPALVRRLVNEAQLQFGEDYV